MNPFISAGSRLFLVLLVLPAFGSFLAGGAEPKPLSAADRALAAYFRHETLELASRCLQELPSAESWKSRAQQHREELLEMLGLFPLPDRTELKPVVTGKIEHEQFTVENLHFQSMPGLYVPANLYVPKGLPRPAPAVLYVCGHASVITNGVSYGNKTAYQHHGIWFARNGYVCLVIDTLQLGEIQGLHHGIYREGMWWWNARGYTPAGIEAWNSIRALDYLQSRPEVDGARLGITGRSGGGAYSWTVAALDERVKAAAPVAGITDLENYVVDGAVEGHCDCMFFVNTFRWDYPLLAALTAPRPLLICNTDKDSIFPLNGVVRLHAKVAELYKVHNATNHLGLLITEGPHKDTQDLQLPVFRWFNQHLKGEDPVIEMATRKLFTPQQLKVFQTLPADQRNTRIYESFVPAAPGAAVPQSTAEWARQRDEWMRQLREKVFRGWPDSEPPLKVRWHQETHGEGVVVQTVEFESQPNVPLRMAVLRSASVDIPERIVLSVLAEEDWQSLIKASPLIVQASLIGNAGGDFPFDEAARRKFAKLHRQLEETRTAMAFFAPRGIGSGAWTGDSRKQTQIRRRFMLLGQTLDGMRVWDIRRAVQTLRSTEPWRSLPVTLQGEGLMGVNALYAALFAPEIDQLELGSLPASHRTGPDYLNVLRFLDVPQAVALAAGQSRVKLITENADQWKFSQAVQQRLAWPKDRFELVNAAQ